MGKSFDLSLQAQVLEGLQRPRKAIPCCLLYDDRGSELYERITELEEYYPFRVEEARLKEHAHDIASQIPEDSVLVELGCGTARKSGIVLSAVQTHHSRYVNPHSLIRFQLHRDWNVRAHTPLGDCAQFAGVGLWVSMSRRRSCRRRAPTSRSRGWRRIASRWWRASTWWACRECARCTHLRICASCGWEAPWGTSATWALCSSSVMSLPRSALAARFSFALVITYKLFLTL